jgi:hypothetical protein
LYPAHYANLFPPFPRNNKVFVAMSFAKEFEHRWEKVIKPGIARVRKNNVPLEAHRVDIRVVGDSILTEILDGITTARLILADVTTLHTLNGTSCRNSNVMYEVGIAHALRLPEEVLLFRSDNDRLLFDLSNVRINSYDPGRDEAGARDKIANGVINALKEVDHRKSLFVQRAAEMIDGLCVDLLILASENNGILEQPRNNNIADSISNLRYQSAFERMLELGILSFENFKLTEELLNAGPNTPTPYVYRVTPFGDSVMELLMSKIGFDDPKLADRVKALMDANNVSPGSV